MSAGLVGWERGGMVQGRGRFAKSLVAYGAVQSISTRESYSGPTGVLQRLIRLGADLFNDQPAPSHRTHP